MTKDQKNEVIELLKTNPGDPSCESGREMTRVDKKISYDKS